MFSVLKNAWKVKEIRNKLIYVLIVLAIYRLGAHIPLPGIDLALLRQARFGAQETASIFTLIAGGGYGTLFALGIGPYITASIIMQLLTVAIPKLEQIQKEGEDGRKKINQYTRGLAVALAALQGGATVYSLQYLFTHRTWLVYIMATVALIAGTLLILWISELLTEKGIGNGSSFIIFANILSGLGNAVNSFYVQLVGGDAWAYIKVFLLLVLFIGVIAFVILVQDGERRIPVQHSKKMVGRQMYGGQSSHIPIKVNIAGVISIIFAISLLQFPSVLYQFFKADWLAKVVNFLSITDPVKGVLTFGDTTIPYAIPFGTLIYVVLIFAFTFFYTSFNINPNEMAENMKKSGGFIPGIRPGKPTSDYIQTTVDRLSWIGALFYALIAILPVLFQWIFGFRVGFGGTTLLIVTGVALDLVKQLEAQLLMRHYKGFLS